MLVLAALLTTLVALTGAMIPPNDRENWKTPIILGKSGGFTIGGRILESSFSSDFTLSCDHGYMEYFFPWRQRKTSIVMWHSSSTQTWQNRFDGGEGYKDMFLRRNYPVFLWDAPRLGRANWGCAPYSYTPSYRDQGNFVAWNFGPAFGRFWPGVQFPVADEEAWQQATSARYVEFDTVDNVHVQAQAAAVAADSGKVGDSIVWLTNSASAGRALMAATKSNSTNIKGIVTYEGLGYVYPDTANITVNPSSPMGPFVVPLADFMKLTRLPIQFLWGDHRGPNDTWANYVAQSTLSAAWINYYGGDAEVVSLAQDEGLTGSTHIAFADMDNDKVAAVLDKFLAKNKLDAYTEGDEDETTWDQDWKNL
ncbi:hypothetical protein F4778DRAFT_793719 [Xylariomycetidae sp. FL2044]|nr:hypothetical protein F4778DRAFT_793719 [Xylariomycetidae sp. FL2044]